MSLAISRYDVDVVDGGRSAPPGGGGRLGPTPCSSRAGRPCPPTLHAAGAAPAADGLGSPPLGSGYPAFCRLNSRPYGSAHSGQRPCGLLTRLRRPLQAGYPLPRGAELRSPLARTGAGAPKPLGRFSGPLSSLRDPAKRFPSGSHFPPVGGCESSWRTTLTGPTPALLRFSVLLF
jgi:hypothetical protein